MGLHVLLHCMNQEVPSCHRVHSPTLHMLDMNAGLVMKVLLPLSGSLHCIVYVHGSPSVELLDPSHLVACLEKVCYS